MERDAPKIEFRVQWCGSGAFVAKNSNKTLLHELLHFCEFGAFCTKFRAVAKLFQNAPERGETHPSMSLGSNGVDRDRSLQKIQTRHHGTNFCINCTSLARFAASFMQ